MQSSQNSSNGSNHSMVIEHQNFTMFDTSNDDSWLADSVELATALATSAISEPDPIAPAPTTATAPTIQTSLPLKSFNPLSYQWPTGQTDLASPATEVRLFTTSSPIKKTDSAESPAMDKNRRIPYFVPKNGPEPSILSGPANESFSNQWPNNLSNNLSAIDLAPVCDSKANEIWLNRYTSDYFSFSSQEPQEPANLGQSFSRLMNCSESRPLSAESQPPGLMEFYQANLANSQPPAYTQLKIYEQFGMETTSGFDNMPNRDQKFGLKNEANAYARSLKQDDGPVSSINQLIESLTVLRIELASKANMNLACMDARSRNLLKLLRYGLILSRELHEDQASNYLPLYRLVSQIHVDSQSISPQVLSNARAAVINEKVLTCNGNPYLPKAAGYHLNGRSNGYNRLCDSGATNNQSQTRMAWDSPNETPNGNRRQRGRHFPSTRMECVFCKNNGETPQNYKSHILKDQDGIVMCPILRAYNCPICKNGGGDHAHTVRYCPENKPTAIVTEAAAATAEEKRNEYIEKLVDEALARQIAKQAAHEREMRAAVERDREKMPAGPRAIVKHQNLYITPK